MAEFMRQGEPGSTFALLQFLMNRELRGNDDSVVLILGLGIFVAKLKSKRPKYPVPTAEGEMFSSTRVSYGLFAVDKAGALLRLCCLCTYFPLLLLCSFK